MKKVFLLILCALILQINNINAQMQSVMTTSTQRQGAPQPEKVVKSVAIDPQQVLTAVQLNNTRSEFYLTIDGNQQIPVATLNNVLIEDFDVRGHDIFFCGSDLTNNLGGEGFVGITDLGALVAGLNYNKILFPSEPFTKITKIDFYNNGTDKLSLIAIDGADIGYYVDYNIATSNYNVFNYHCQLLDVVHTTNYIGVLGTINDSTFTIISHDINNPINVTTNNVWYFKTPQVYTNDQNIGYYIDAIDDGLNNVVVAYPSHGNYGLELFNIDLSTVSINNVQGISSSYIMRAELSDIKYNKYTHLLQCIYRNGGTVLKNEIIENINPYPTVSYTANVVIPNSNINTNQLTRLCIYDHNFYLAVGKDASNYMYWFDKLIGLTNSQCHSNNTYHVDIINRHKFSRISWFYNSNIAMITQEPITASLSKYAIICQ